MEPLTDNLSRWKYYLKDVTSPDSFIEWGFYYIIAASLQRRVWTGSMRKPLFSNLYVILTGEPGIGKGLVVTEVGKILRFHRQTKEQQLDNITSRDEFAKKVKDSPFLIPVGPDASTYEALVKILSRSMRTHSYFEKQEDGKTLAKLYGHSSLALCLEEISSLFRKHTEDLVNFLLVTYDCGNYIYETISRGEDSIKNCCLNMIAGTTPSFIKRVFGDELLTDGFASRATFIHATSNRFERARPAEFKPAQIAEYDILLNHIKKLATLFGEVTFTPEALEYLELWWSTAKVLKVNNSPKLIPYYARKNMLVQKLAMVVHFMNSYTMTVGLEDLKMAIVIAEQAEKNMHTAITMDNKNPLAGVSDSIYKYLLANGPARSKKILIDHWGELPEGEKSFKEVMDYLTRSERISLDDKNNYVAKPKER